VLLAKYFATYYSGYQIKKKHGAYGMYGREDRSMKGFCGEKCRRDLGVGRRIFLNKS
jgi:ribosomal protein L24E